MRAQGFSQGIDLSQTDRALSQDIRQLRLQDQAARARLLMLQQPMVKGGSTLSLVLHLLLANLHNALYQRPPLVSQRHLVSSSLDLCLGNRISLNFSFDHRLGIRLISINLDLCISSRSYLSSSLCRRVSRISCISSLGLCISSRSYLISSLCRRVSRINCINSCIGHCLGGRTRSCLISIICRRAGRISCINSGLGRRIGISLDWLGSGRNSCVNSIG